MCTGAEAEVAGAEEAAAEPRVPVLALPRELALAREPHSDLVASTPDAARAPQALAREPLAREPVREQVEGRLPARVPEALPVRPALAPACRRHRSPTAAR